MQKICRQKRDSYCGVHLCMARRNRGLSKEYGSMASETRPGCENFLTQLVSETARCQVIFGFHVPEPSGQSPAPLHRRSYVEARRTPLVRPAFCEERRGYEGAERSG